MNNDKNAPANRPVRLLYPGLKLGRKGPLKFKEKSVTDALGFETLEKRLARISMSGLTTLMSKDMSHVYDTASDAFEDLQAVRPPPMPRHFVPDLADASQYFREYKERRKQIYDNHMEKVLAFEALSPEEQEKVKADIMKKRASRRNAPGGPPPLRGVGGLGSKSPSRR